MPTGTEHETRCTNVAASTLAPLSRPAMRASGYIGPQASRHLNATPFGAPWRSQLCCAPREGPAGSSIRPQPLRRETMLAVLIGWLPGASVVLPRRGGAACSKPARHRETRHRDEHVTDRARPRNPPNATSCAAGVATRHATTHRTARNAPVTLHPSQPDRPRRTPGCPNARAVRCLTAPCPERQQDIQHRPCSDFRQRRPPAVG